MKCFKSVNILVFFYFYAPKRQCLICDFSRHIPWTAHHKQPGDHQIFEFFGPALFSSVRELMYEGEWWGRWHRGNVSTGEISLCWNVWTRILMLVEFAPKQPPLHNCCSSSSCFFSSFPSSFSSSSSFASSSSSSTSSYSSSCAAPYPSLYHLLLPVFSLSVLFLFQ